MKKLLIPVCTIFLIGCYYDKEEELYPTGGCDTTDVTFTVDVQPILNESCALSGCHDAATKSFGHDLSNYDGTVTAVNSNRFLGAINQEAGFNAMPKNMQKLDDCSIAIISAWINAGTPQ